jgi:hypothetical protein
MRSVTRLLAASLILAMPATAQDSTRNGDVAPRRVPFGVGELLEYDVKFNLVPWNVGRGSMEVFKLDTIRGREAWHTVLSIRGGIPGYRVNDRFESWIDTRTLSSLRYVQDIHDGPYNARRHFEIFPDKRLFQQDSQPLAESVENPLDEGSFLFFLRTIPLTVGLDTSFSNYFRPERNPVRIRVIRKDTIRVPAGRFPAIVVQPMIANSKIFSEGGHAEVWLSDDDNRIMLQMKSKLSFGSLSLYLKSFRPAPTTPAPAAKTDRPPTPGR